MIALMDPMSPPRPASPARFGAYLYSVFGSAFNDNVHCFAIALYLTQHESAIGTTSSHLAQIRTERLE